MFRCRQIVSAVGRAALLTPLLWTFACSEASLQPVALEAVELNDNLLEISGQICTSPPSEELFPVKIMFIVDSSGSMQFTDPSANTASGCTSLCQTPAPNGLGLAPAACSTLCAGAENPGRQGAVQRVIDRFASNPAVSFSIIRFNGRVTVNGSVPSEGSGFTNDPSVLNQAAAELAQADITTDYQGALSTALRVLERDMIDSEPVQRARTKYVLIFFSDGAPDPLCQKGCGNDQSTIAGIVVDNWCDTPRDGWCELSGPGGRIVVSDPAQCELIQTNYPAMEEPCQAYNTPEEIDKKVNQIMGLAERYSVGELRLNTAFLWVDSLPEAVQQIFNLDKDRSEELLRRMATAGDGLYRSFNAGQAIDFLDINYSSVARPFGMTSFIVTNTNALPQVTKLGVDSDGDGVEDGAEFAAGIKDNRIDTDGDGFSDKLEYDRRSAGFDPLDPTVPVRICPQGERIDRDGDGLLDCEEAVLGTDPKLADSDRDRVHDGLEFTFGTNPLQPDSELDIDFDGHLSLNEIRDHASPALADPEIHANFRYLYELNQLPARIDRRTCWDFAVRNVQLVTTKQRGLAGTLGFNEVLLYFGEGPADDPRDFGNYKAACVRAKYVQQACNEGADPDLACGYKEPASGKVVLQVEDFYDLPELVNRRRIAATNRAADPCRGVELP